MGWVVNVTPRPLYTRERPGTHCTGAGWAPGPPPRDSIPEPSTHTHTYICMCVFIYIYIYIYIYIGTFFVFEEKSWYRKHQLTARMNCIIFHAMLNCWTSTNIYDMFYLSFKISILFYISNFLLGPRTGSDTRTTNTERMLQTILTELFL